jgi:hypothetical protein
MNSPLHSHGLADPHELANDGWLPATDAARELSACIETCKQINEMRGAFGAARPTPRQLTVLATPLCSLVEHVLALKRLLHDADRSVWPAGDLATFSTLGRSLKRANKGSLRKIRNMRSAHANPQGLRASSIPPSTAENVLVYVGEAASLLLLCLNHERVFGYYRMPEPGDDSIVEIFNEYPAATTVRVGDDRRVREILQIHIEADPRHAQNAVVRETLALYNQLVIYFAGLPSIRLESYARHPRSEH